MADAEFEFEHNRNMHDVAERLQEIQNTMDTAISEAAEEIGLRVLATAARLVNVDTGRLRASLSIEVEELGEFAAKVAVGSNVSYADIHESEFPFLRPAIEENRTIIQEIIRDAMQQAVEATE